MRGRWRFWLRPAATNTGAATISIDTAGVVGIKDNFGAALQGGELIGGGSPGLSDCWDGTNFCAVVTAGSARPSGTTAADIIATGTQGLGHQWRHIHVRRLSSAHVQYSGAQQYSRGAIDYKSDNATGRDLLRRMERCPPITVGIHQTRLFNATDSR